MSIICEFASFNLSVQIENEDNAAIYFTSGTTGKLKAVLLSHKAFSYGAIVELSNHKQQISNKSRETIWQRNCFTFGNVVPTTMLSINDSELRGFDLYSCKIECVKVLAEWVIKKKINFEEFLHLTNDVIITKLTVLKGI